MLRHLDMTPGRRGSRLLIWEVYGDQPDIEEAGETLEELGAVWAGAPKKTQREMLKVIFEAVYFDVSGERLVCVKPYPQFAPLYRMDGMEKREDGCFTYREEDQEAGSAC